MAAQRIGDEGGIVGALGHDQHLRRRIDQRGRAAHIIFHKRITRERGQLGVQSHQAGGCRLVAKGELQDAGRQLHRLVAQKRFAVPQAQPTSDGATCAVGRGRRLHGDNDGELLADAQTLRRIHRAKRHLGPRRHRHRHDIHGKAGIGGAAGFGQGVGVGRQAVREQHDAPATGQQLAGGAQACRKVAGGGVGQHWGLAGRRRRLRAAHHLSPKIEHLHAAVLRRRQTRRPVPQGRPRFRRQAG